MHSRTDIYRDLAQGADAAHSAILSSMRDDGVDARGYLQQRRTAFRDVVALEEEQKDAFLAPPGESDPGRSGKIPCCPFSAHGSLFSWNGTEGSPLGRMLCVCASERGGAC